LPVYGPIWRFDEDQAKSMASTMSCVDAVPVHLRFVAQHAQKSVSMLTKRQSRSQVKVKRKLYNLLATGFTNPPVGTSTPWLFPPMETFGFNVNIKRMILTMLPSMPVIHTSLKQKAIEYIYFMWVIVLM
jgi:hypothetical protein